MTARLVFLLAVWLLVPAGVWAGDSDCFSTYRSGAYQVVECFICDGDHSATDCAEFDLLTESGLGLPEFAVFDLAATTGCSGAVSVDIRGLSQQLGVAHIYDTLTAAGTSSVLVPELRHRHLDADVDITTSALCSDLELIGRFFYPRVTE